MEYYETGEYAIVYHYCSMAKNEFSATRNDRKNDKNAK